MSSNVYVDAIEHSWTLGVGEQCMPNWVSKALKAGTAAEARLCQTVSIIDKTLNRLA